MQRQGDTPAVRFGRQLSALATRRAWPVVLVALAMVALAAWGAQFIQLRFFPQADRNTVVVDLEMPEGTHLEATDAVALRLERALEAESARSPAVATFIGRAAPKFYYNLTSRPNSPHRAQLVTETTTFKGADRLIDWVGDWARREVPEASVVARRLEQGPPFEAPVELRVMGHDLGDLETVADQVLAELRATPGTRDVRHDLGLGVPTVSFEIDDAAAGRSGLNRADVAQALLGRTLGAQVGQYRQGEDPVPILLRSSDGELLPPAELATIDVARPGGKAVPLAQVARLDVEWRPAVILHHNRQRVVHVQAQTLPGVTPHEVLQGGAVAARRQLQLPAGVRLEMGGELEQANKANSAIVTALPIGMLLLLFFLILEFNSFRRMAIILVKVPLAAIGVVPGLILAGQPFGFMAILGLIALVGIVVNNGIVLIDLIEVRRKEGAGIDEAIEDAIVRRTRPILLTAATAVLGLLPLGFTEATLWPPLAWTIMSGLTTSTLLTLLVVPSVYKLVFAHQDREPDPAPGPPPRPARRVCRPAPPPAESCCWRCCCRGRSRAAEADPGRGDGQGRPAAAGAGGGRPGAGRGERRRRQEEGDLLAGRRHGGRPDPPRQPDHHRHPDRRLHPRRTDQLADRRPGDPAAARPGGRLLRRAGGPRRRRRPPPRAPLQHRSAAWRRRRPNGSSGCSRSTPASPPPTLSWPASRRGSARWTSGSRPGGCSRPTRSR